MEAWKAKLKADPTDWLLEESNPSVRYFTLKDLLNLPEDDPDVLRASQAIMQSGLVPIILKKQRDAAYIETYPRFYRDKYKGLVWSLITLAELGAEPVPQILTQCEYILTHSQEITDGGFSCDMSKKTDSGLMYEVVPCLTGNMVFSLLRFGYGGDERLMKGIDWIVRFMRYNDGEELDPQIPPYNHYNMCWGSHTCFMGAVKALKALSAVPLKDRTEEIDEAIKKAAEFMLIHHVHRRSHNYNKIAKPGWLNFSFPLMYQTDALETLDILTSLGYKDPRMQEAVDAVIAKQDDMGRWKTENTLITDKLIVPFGHKGEQSKWITLRAVRILKQYHTNG